MTLLALVCALLLEQLRALPRANPVLRAYRRYLRLLQRAFNDGGYKHGILAWCAAVGVPVLLVGGVSAYLAAVAPPVALLFHIAVLYLTMGFRQFSHAYTQILEGLRGHDLARARSVLGRWLGRDTANYRSSEIARLAIEHGLVEGHRHVFGLIAWYALFGPAGAVLYRLSAALFESWGQSLPAEERDFGRFSRAAFEWIDWIPVRLTAASFAVVGDFEDAVYCWRGQALTWPERLDGIILASGAGAIGVRLGSAIGDGQDAQLRPELGTGDEADAELMTSTVGLIWRALVLWLFVILLVTVASWFA